VQGRRKLDLCTFSDSKPAGEAHKRGVGLEGGELGSDWSATRTINHTQMKEKASKIVAEKGLR